MALEEVSVFIVLFLSQDVSGPLHKQLLPRWSLDLWWACLGEWLPLSEDSVSMVICLDSPRSPSFKLWGDQGEFTKRTGLKHMIRNKGPQHSELVCYPLDFNVYLPGMKGETVEEKSLGFHFYRNFKNKIKKSFVFKQGWICELILPKQNKTKQSQVD